MTQTLAGSKQFLLEMGQVSTTEIAHGFERFAPNSKVARRAMNDLMRVIQSL
jgi:hypothetical protein